MVLSDLLTAVKAQEGVLPATYTHIADAATTEVMAGAGWIVGINLNSLGTVAAGATIYDAASAAAIAGSLEIGHPSWTTLAATPAYLPIGPDGDGLAVNNGIVIVTTGTFDITVASRAK